MEQSEAIISGFKTPTSKPFLSNLKINLLGVLENTVRSPNVLDPVDVKNPIIRGPISGNPQPVISPGESQKHIYKENEGLE